MRLADGRDAQATAQNHSDGDAKPMARSVGARLAVVLVSCWPMLPGMLRDLALGRLRFTA